MRWCRGIRAPSAPCKTNSSAFSLPFRNASSSPAGDDDAFLNGSEKADEFVLHGALGARMPRHQRIGGIPDHRHQPVGTQGLEFSVVADRTDDGVGIEFPVAGMQDLAVP